MQNGLVQFIIRQFSGKVSALVNSAILFLVLHAMAYLAAKCPSVAAICDPQAVATWLSALLIAGLNAASNSQHLLDKATMAKVIESLKANPPVIPVEKAEPIH